MVNMKLFYYKIKIINKLKHRQLLQKIYDWLWFYWYLGGDYENKKLKPQYNKQLIQKRKKARELNDYYKYKNDTRKVNK